MDKIEKKLANLMRDMKAELDSKGLVHEDFIVPYQRKLDDYICANGGIAYYMVPRLHDRLKAYASEIGVY